MSASPFLLSCCALALLSAASAARADTLIVIEAHGVSLAPGDAVDSAKPLHLAEDQRLTLVAADGRTIKVQGAWDRPPSEAAEPGAVGMLTLLKELAAGRAPDSRTLGALRSGAEVAPLPDPWLIAVGQPGAANYCLRDGQAPVLWRASAGKATTVQIAPADRSWQAQANWPAGSERLAVPARVPLQDGEAYVFDVDGQSTRATMYRVPGTVTGAAMQAAWLMVKGCEAQALALARTDGTRTDGK